VLPSYIVPDSTGEKLLEKTTDLEVRSSTLLGRARKHRYLHRIKFNLKFGSNKEAIKNYF